MVKILVIAQQEAEDLCTGLSKSGFALELITAEKATAAQLRRIPYSLILCERKALSYPNIKSFIGGQNAPVLWLLHAEDLPKTVRKFRMGLEDYIILPAGTTELLTRIHMLMRCAGIDMGRKLSVGNLFLNVDARTAVADGKEIQLTAREFNLIFGLLSAPEKAFTRKELIQKYWSDGGNTSPRVVDVYITKLREKFSNCRSFQIVTVHGIGYKAVLQAERAEEAKANLHTDIGEKGSV